MNQNPWQVESMAQYERQRIMRDMNQIRLEQAALKGRRTEKVSLKKQTHRPRLVLRLVLGIVRLLVSAVR